jgi:hypothetical protein
MAKKKLNKNVVVKKSSKQKKGQQKQSQSVSVNIDLGKKGRRSKPTNPKLPLQPQFPPNYPPFYNPNMPNWLVPPPQPQKQYSVYPEGETALDLGLLPNVQVPLRVEGSSLKEKKETRLEQYKVINEPFKPPEEEYQLIERPELAPAAPFIAEEPLFLPVEGEQFKPPEGALLTDPFKPAEFPQEPPSPTASTISSLSEPVLGGELNPSFYNVAGLGLSKISKSLPLPPIGLSTQPLTSSGLTTYSQPTNFPLEYLFEEGAAEKPKKKKGLASIVVGELPPPAELAKKKAGRPKGASNKPKYETTVPEGQSQFAVPVKETLAFPAESFYSAPLAEQPLAQFLGTEKTFSTEPEKVSGGLERRRRETALTPAEQTLLSNPLGNPLFA